MIKLDIMSDPICPWCYIGKANLDRALGRHPDHPFEIEWHPFQLNPTMPPEGMGRREYLERKFGGAEGARQTYGHIADAAKAAGLDADLDAIQVTPNTIDAHRLIHWAGLEGRQTATVSSLFKAYFCDGKNIGDTDVLLEIAAGVGMDRDMTARLFASGADLDDITARDKHAREKGVSAVPTFIVGNQAVVQGAQPTEFWEEVITDYQQALQDQSGDAQ